MAPKQVLVKEILRLKTNKQAKSVLNLYFNLQYSLILPVQIRYARNILLGLRVERKRIVRRLHVVEGEVGGAKRI